MTLIGSLSSAIADIADTTLAAPIISARISPIADEGLIEIPPLSNVTPLPIEYHTNRHSNGKFDYDSVISIHLPTKTTGLSFLFPPA